MSTQSAIKSQDLQRTSEVLVASISQMILDGELGPGDRLKLPELARRFGVSLMPVREALWKLEGSGLIQNIPNKGAVVRGLDEQHISNVYEVRSAIEAALIERAVQAATSSDIDRIAQTKIDFERAAATGDARALLKADGAFHSSINTITQNDIAVSILQSSLQLIGPLRLRVGYEQSRIDEIVREHDAIFAAIREGDARLAAQCMRLHTNSAKQSTIMALRKAMIPAGPRQAGKRRSAVKEAGPIPAIPIVRERGP